MTSPRVQRIASPSVPTDYGMCQMVGYEDLSTGGEHIALCFGDLDSQAPLVRIHSECITGEAFGSLKCECGPQLRAAMAACAREGGVILYLRGQEGRGIGLLNKLKAYQLQQTGLDTVQANEALGLPAEAREYEAAIGMLQDLGISTVTLFSNNPAKKSALEMGGIVVAETRPLLVGVNEHNRKYLETKVTAMGHTIDPEDLT